MLSDTLQEGLGRYHIGEKLRRLRLKKKIGLTELGKHTGLPARKLNAYLAVFALLGHETAFPTIMRAPNSST